ncbi:zinc ribbon domain-containing protein [Butyricicoccus pullicaecorum]|uniref:Uncharacterized protein n=1 Tax=Butyricicoccus pullicaecorum TaxID=501571 RepID=A0A1Y4LR19_9FIRM|nr:zinc ribbon domain-containing protein [Butyricicoccus pullicaecorum]OUP59058.1 hypothetical protein B5F15_06210 [Butyricicoccus pullicaecorum]
MTREEAINILSESKRQNEVMRDNPSTFWASHQMADGVKNAERRIAALDLALTALRPVSRERVERIRGEWVAKHRHRGGFRRVTGVDDMGEQRTITIDERCEYDDRYCSKCGKQSPDNFLNFCGYCGAPMTDEAVDMILERWKEALKND